MKSMTSKKNNKNDKFAHLRRKPKPPRKNFAEPYGKETIKEFTYGAKPPKSMAEIPTRCRAGNRSILETLSRNQRRDPSY